MIAEYRTKGQLAIGVALLGDVSVAMLGRAHSPLYLPALAAELALCAYACSMYARAKGFSPWLGVLAPLLVIGLVCVMLLPDRRRNPLLDNEKIIQEPKG